jgi:superfamily I DNA and/or RNA helicase
MNVAISRARDAVYLVGDLKYVKSKNVDVLKKLAELGVVEV